MIERIETLMIHWGEQCRRSVHGCSLGSQLGAMIEWGGQPPRSVYGSIPLISGGGVDHIAAEVDAALAVLVRQGDRQDAELAKAWLAAGQSGRAPFCLETQLVKLARARYLVDPAPLVEQQMKRCLIDGRRTYDRRVGELHARMQELLKMRAEARAALPFVRARCRIREDWALLGVIGIRPFMGVYAVAFGG